ncbi:MAG: hypothetical protein KF763_05310 [Cyclobacteriaceae bacterium]|nr:hypothetical protein [Cyclobacteriaceae bacterium]
MKQSITVFVLLLFSWVLYGQNLDIYNDCPLEGKVSQNNAPERIRQLEALNRLKNRYNFPAAADFDNSVTLEKMLEDRGKPDRNKFNVNKAATIEGYIVYAAKKGSSETCNCKSTSTFYTDQHLELALTPDEPKDGSTITVEITPRLRELMHQQGIDWTHGEIQNYVGRKVRISGWLFYDAEHEKDACSYNPQKCGDVAGYNRQTCWEVHPVTSFEDITEEYLHTEDVVIANNVESEADFLSVNTSVLGTNSNTSTKPLLPMDYLILILLGGIVGTVGQLLRVIVGLKKAADANVETDYRRTTFSLVMAFAIGGVAGVLAAINMTSVETIDKSTLLAFLTAGYAGTDFIEGFISKNKIANSSPPTN